MWCKIGKVSLIMLLVAGMFCSLARGVTEYKASEEIYPFRWLNVEKYLDDIWIGDTLTMVNSENIFRPEASLYDYSFEIIEGNSCAQLINKTEKTTEINFIKEGIVRLKVVRSSDNAERIFQFKVGPAKPLTYRSEFPQSIKIGHKMSGEWFQYSNLFLEQSIAPVGVVSMNYDEYCILPDGAFGYGGWEYVTREAMALNTGKDNDEYQYLWGSPTRPGTIYYSTALEPDKQYSIVIEEPVIESNLSQEVIVGSVIQVKTSLMNTALTDKKVEVVKEIIEKDDTKWEHGELIGYQPRIEVVSGNDLIKRENGDYSNILSTSEKITFLKEGTVVFRVVYEMLPITEGEWRLLKQEAIYSPEETFTVKIVKEVATTEQPQNNPSTEPEQNIPNGTEKEQESSEQPQNNPSVEPGQNISNESEKNPVSSEEKAEDTDGIKLDYTKETITTESLLEAIEALKEMEKVEVQVSTNVTIAGSVLSELKDGQHDFTINVENEDGNLLYSWNVESILNVVNEWKTGIDIGADVEQITDLLSEIQHTGAVTTISFEHNGILPGKTNVQLFVGNKFNSEEKVFYYYHNLEKNMFEKVGEYVVDENGYVSVEMEHCSDYILTDKELSQSISIDTERIDTEELDAEEKNESDKSTTSSNSGKIFAIIVVPIIVVFVIVGVIYIRKKYK